MGKAHRDYLNAQKERARIRREKNLGCRKKGSAKAQNRQAAASICLVCGLNRLKCICAGHMSETAIKAFHEGQKQRPTPKQARFG